MKKLISIILLAVSAIALSGCDDKSEDGRFQSVDLVSNGSSTMTLFIDHYAHKYYFVNSHGGTPLEITAAQAGKYADQIAPIYQDSDIKPQSAPVQQPVAPVIINNRNN